ncbi:hypothetical protein [Fibrella aquatica]|uniref:hypothetical protein n=1 Tax=Fibrella aquatica TaxID=3242487 RepID=UPI003521FA51
MPINYKLNYNPNFKKLSAWIRFERAKNCCEQCGIRNYTVIEYLDEAIDDTHPFDTFKEARAFADAQNQSHQSAGKWNVRFSVVTLTVAHLDHNEKNDALDNLKALCNRCHLNFDRRDNWKRRRYGKTGRFHKQLVISL